MRHITPKGIDLIKRFEGAEAHIYEDAAGYPTIGYGHLLRVGEAEFFAKGISHEDAEALLIKDVQVAERAVLRYISVPLTDGQFDALVSFTFNLGSGALQRSTLRQKVNRAEHSDASIEFLRWIYAGGRKLRGLIKRRQAEIFLYLP